MARQGLGLLAWHLGMLSVWRSSAMFSWQDRASRRGAGQLSQRRWRKKTTQPGRQDKLPTRHHKLRAWPALKHQQWHGNQQHAYTGTDERQTRDTHVDLGAQRQLDSQTHEKNIEFTSLCFYDDIQLYHKHFQALPNHQIKPNLDKSNQIEPNQTKSNQTKPNQTKPNQAYALRAFLTSLAVKLLGMKTVLAL